MTPEEFERYYREDMYSHIEAFTERLRALCQDLLDQADIPIAQIESRVKSPASVTRKIERKVYDDPAAQIKDLAGLRIITYYPDEAIAVAELLKREFKVDEAHSIDKLVELGEEAFGYRSIHLVVALSETRARLVEWSRFTDLFAEIQVRSVLQHAWAAISHKLDYKAVAQVPPVLRRQLFRLSALLELADEDFVALRDHSREVIKAYREDVDRGEFELPLNLDSLRAYLMEREDMKMWESIGLQVGMEPHKLGALVGDKNEDELERLFLTLHTIGLKTITEVRNLLANVSQEAKEKLSKFVRAVETRGGVFKAIALDILTILVSIDRAERLPDDFNWGTPFNEPRQAVLREFCDLTSRETNT